MQPVSKPRSYIDMAVLVILILCGIYFRDDISNFIHQQRHSFAPCSVPVTYTLGTFDTRFGISKKEFLSALTKAEAIWELPSEKNLFEYIDESDTDTSSTTKSATVTSTSASTTTSASKSTTSSKSAILGFFQTFKHHPSGADVIVNLQYDYRQQVTDQLGQIDGLLATDRSAYMSLEGIYKNQLQQYNKNKSALSSAIQTYQSQKAIYDRDVASYNSNGGSRDEYDSLEKRRQNLNNQVADIKSAERDINALASTVDKTVADLNVMIQKFNLKVNTYNTVSSTTGPEFNEGEYIVDASGRRINIYQFENNNKLVRVLAHELGHALGLDHIDNPKAIMYRLNSGTNERLIADDLTQLTNLCQGTKEK